jgi:hypothetical protein
MKQTRGWLPVVLPCTPQEWQELLPKRLLPFLEAATGNGHVTDYSIEWNYNGREYIRLSLLVKDQQQDGLRQLIQKHFAAVTAGNAVKTCSIVGNGGRGLTGIPVNEVCFEPYRKEMEKSLQRFNLQLHLTQILLLLFKETGIDPAAIFTVACQLMLGLLRSCRKLVPAAFPLLGAWYATAAAGNMPVDRPALEALLSQNAAFIATTAASFINAPVKSLPLWVQAWIAICHAELKSNLAVGPTAAQIMLRHNRIVYLVHATLGMQMNEILILTHFMNEAMAAAVIKTVKN